MGNIIHGEREEGIKPESALFTVTAAGTFKAKLNRAKRKTTADQIDEILEWKFRRKDTLNSPGRLATVDEEHEQNSASFDDQEREVMKFVHR